MALAPTPSLAAAAAWRLRPPTRAVSRLSPLQQSLLLALLLHLWLALLLGNSPPGTALPGQGVWGRLNVRLQDSDGPGAQARLALPAQSAVPSPERGEAARDAGRVGGRVRPDPGADAPVGAAREGQWREQAAPRTLGQGLGESGLVAPLGPVQRLASPVTPAAQDALQALALPEALPRLSKLPDSRAATPAPQRLSATPLAPVTAAPTEALEAPPSLPRLSRLEAAPALQEPLPRITQAPLAPLPQGVDAQALGSVVPAPRLNRLEPAAAPAPLPLAPLAATPSPPKDPSALQAPPRELALPEMPATAAAKPPVPAPEAAPTTPPTAAQAQPASSAATTTPAAPGAPQRAAAGAPDAGAQLGRDRAVPAAAAASRPLDLSLPRELLRGGELAGRASRGLLPVLPRPPETKDDKDAVSEAIKKAAREDCRQAHADKGLLAALPLAAGAVRDKGCRW